VSSLQHICSCCQNEGKSVDKRLNRRLFGVSTRLEVIETRRPIEQSVQTEIGKVGRGRNVFDRSLADGRDVRVGDDVGDAARGIDSVVDGGRREPEQCAHAKIEPILSDLMPAEQKQNYCSDV
jgi:hypothetical protein